MHSIAFAPREALAGDFLDGLTREAFRVAHDISATAFPRSPRPRADDARAPRRAAHADLPGRGARGAHYNVMGLAKASLEAGVRYLAQSLGPEGHSRERNFRGPIKTLAAAGIADFGKILISTSTAPLKRNVTDRGCRQCRGLSLSDLAAGITGEILYVDSGFNHIALDVEAS